MLDWNCLSFVGVSDSYNLSKLVPGRDFLALIIAGGSGWYRGFLEQKSGKGITFEM